MQLYVPNKRKVAGFLIKLLVGILNEYTEF